MLKIVFGSLKAKHSYIEVNGKKTIKAYLTGKIGYLPQDSFLPTSEKVSQLMQLFAPTNVQIKILMADERIKTLVDKKIYQLSGGELRYLEIYLLLIQPTDFILLDEPFTGLEPIYMQHIANVILRYRKHKGFVISDHNYRNVLDIATSIMLLENGACRQIQDKKQLEFFYFPEGSFDKD